MNKVLKIRKVSPFGRKYIYYKVIHEDDTELSSGSQGDGEPGREGEVISKPVNRRSTRGFNSTKL